MDPPPWSQRTEGTHGNLGFSPRETCVQLPTPRTIKIWGCFKATKLVICYSGKRKNEHRRLTKEFQNTN